jgi:hypothetical protein
VLSLKPNKEDQMQSHRAPALFVGAVLFLIGVPTYCQPPDTLWTRTYGGPNYDEGRSVQETLDGGYIMAGYTEDFGGGLRNVWLVKTAVDGDTVWTRTFGGIGFHFGNCVRQTSDGGYIVVGATSDLTLVADVFLVKTDADGNAEWTRTFGGTEYDEGRCVQEASGGGYVVVGFTESSGAGNADVYLIRTDENGDTLWTRTYGGQLWDEGNSVQETADGGFIVAGYRTLYSDPNGGDSDIYMVKTDAGGDTLWTRLYGLNPGQWRDYGYSVQQTSDGGYIVSGETWYPGSPAWEIDVYLVRTDPGGDSIWTRTYDRSERTDVGRFVQQTEDGGFIVAGYTHVLGTDYDVYLIRTDAAGDTLWTKRIGSAIAAVPWEEGWAVDQTSDGGYIVTGWTYSYGAGGHDAWLVKLGPETYVEESGSSRAVPTALSISPNLFRRATAISYSLPAETQVALAIHDIAGRLVETLVNETQQPGIHQVMWDRMDNPSGVYFCRLRACPERSDERFDKLSTSSAEPRSRRAGAFVETKKMVLLN